MTKSQDGRSLREKLSTEHRGNLSIKRREGDTPAKKYERESKETTTFVGTKSGLENTMKAFNLTFGLQLVNGGTKSMKDDEEELRTTFSYHVQGHTESKNPSGEETIPH